MIKIWSIRSGDCLKTLTGHVGGIACTQFDGQRIISGGSDKTIRIFDRMTGNETTRLKSHSDIVRTVKASFEDDTRLVSGSYDNRAFIWHWDSEKGRWI